jgi:hypothetical protein
MWREVFWRDGASVALCLDSMTLFIVADFTYTLLKIKRFCKALSVTIANFKGTLLPPGLGRLFSEFLAIPGERGPAP